MANLPQKWLWEGLGKIAAKRRDFSVDAALTEEEIEFLEQLADAAAIGRIITGLGPRAKLLRLVHFKYVTEQSMSLDAVVNCITDAGRAALAQAKGKRSID